LKLVALALAPVVAISLYVYVKDKNPEPPRRLLYVFVGSALSVLILLPIFSFLFGHIGEWILGENLLSYAFFEVALAEETTKLVPVLLLAYRSRDFDEPFDGMVYATMGAMGFAAVENLMYVLSGGYGVALLRMFTAVPMHAFAGIFMGYFLGRAKFSPSPLGHVLAGLGTATAMHGFYDYSLFVGSVSSVIFGALGSLIVGGILALRGLKNGNG